MVAGKKKSEEKNTDTLGSTRSLRDGAEEHLARSQKSSPELKGQTPEQLIHELLVHQIELETQAEELSRAHLALEESRDKFLDLYEFAPLGYVTLNDKALVTEANLAFSTLLGIERTKLIRARFGKFVAQKDSDQWYLYFRNALKRDGKQICTLTLTREDGSVFLARLEGLRLTGSDGVTKVRIGISDITDIWQIEALKSQYSILNGILESTDAAILSLDRKYRYTNFNSHHAMVMKQLYGVDIEPGHSIFDYQPFKEEQVRAKNNIDRALAGEHIIEETFSGEEGRSRRYFEVTHYPIKGTGKKVIGVAVFAQDITERKRVEEKVLEAQTRTATVLEGIADTFYSLDDKWRITMVNTAAEKAPFGRPASELLGRVIWEVYPGLVGTFIQQHYFNAAKNFNVEHYEAQSSLNGRWYEVFIHGLRGGVDVYMRDITERKRADVQQQMFIRELEQKNAELEIFTYTASHDLKSPLLTIKWFAGLLEDDTYICDPVQMKKYAHRILEAAETMQTLLTDLLELSLAGKIIKPPEKTGFGTIVKEAVNLLAGPLAERGVTIEIAPDLPDVYVDPTRIREVMINLIENAIKFLGNRPDPVIRIGVDDSGETPVFFVEDNGIGIDSRYLDRIFNLFERLDVSTHGSGIGLPIVRRIIEVHGGKIWAESEGDGMGSTFRFMLPVKKEKPAPITIITDRL